MNHCTFALILLASPTHGYQYVSMQLAYIGLNPNPVLRIYAEDASLFMLTVFHACSMIERRDKTRGLIQRNMLTSCY